MKEKKMVNKTTIGFVGGAENARTENAGTTKYGKLNVT